MRDLEQSIEKLVRDPRGVGRALDRFLAEESLLNFMKLYWQITDPATPLVIGWPLEAICEHLEAVTYGQITRLLMNVPPGFSKSTALDVFWPAWEWGPLARPWLRYIAASYSGGLTIRDNQRFLRVISHELFQRIWGPEAFTLTHVGALKIQNDKTGWKLATSVGGIGTGERGNRFLIDDPNNVKDVESELVREGANFWFLEVVQDRLNNIETDAIIVIQQRTHENDVSGTIMSREMDYEHLCIPMEYDSARHCVTSIGWSDPRTVDGEPAWPERFSPRAIEILKGKGPYAYAGQYQQAPAPRGGGILRNEWWQLWPPQGEEFDDAGRPKAKLRFPPMSFVLASVDTAMTKDKANDQSAMTVWGCWTDNRGEGYIPPNDRARGVLEGELVQRYGVPKLMLMDAWALHLDFHELLEKVIATCRRAKASHLVIEAKANGINLGQEIMRITRGEEWTTHLESPTADKQARAYSIQHLFSAKLIFAPHRTWAQRVIDQCSVFPRGTHDDLVDSTTQALSYLRRIGLANLVQESASDLVQQHVWRKRELPYDV